ncbi:MAG: phosphopyruvate hydratase, partial [Acidobacteriota bacterium]
MIIKEIKARQILDSRGVPTVEADILLEDGSLGRAAVPSGASTGSGEALELRDGGEAFGGKGVTTAVKNIHEVIAPALKGKDAGTQTEIDAVMKMLDGTDNKSKLGANAILAVSLAAAKAVAESHKEPLYKYIADMVNHQRLELPIPLMNVINGGKHAAGSTDIQEFMIVPRGGETFADKLRIGAEVFMALKKELLGQGFGTTVGDEGGFAPAVKGNAEALDLLVAAVKRSGYKLHDDVVFALDVAASELLDEEGLYNLATEGRKLNADEMVAWYRSLSEKYPIVSIEDGLGEKDWEGWRKL